MNTTIKRGLFIIIFSTIILMPIFYYPIWSNPKVKVGQVWRDCDWVNHDNPFSGKECNDNTILQVKEGYVLYHYGKNKNLYSMKLRYFLSGDVKLLKVDKK